MKLNLKLNKLLKQGDWYLVPLIFSLVNFTLVIIWVTLDHSLPHFDMARHLYHTLEYKDLFKEYFNGQRNLLSVFQYYAYYPPLLYIIANLIYLIFGLSIKAALTQNFIWMFILFFSVYNFVRNLWNKKTAFLTILILSAAPIMIGQCRQFQLDMPLTAITALAVFLIYQSKNFTKRIYALYLGVTFGLGMLLKWEFIFFIVPLFLIFLVRSLILDRSKWKLIIQNSFIIVFIAIVLDYVWYIPNRGNLKRDLILSGIGSASLEGDPVGLSLEAILFYPKMFILHYLFLPLSILTSLGFFYSIFNRFAREKNLPLVLWSLLSALAIFLLPNKDTRYLMPLIFVMAILAASLINISRKKAYEVILYSIIILIFVLNNLFVVFGRYLSHDLKPLLVANNLDYPIIDNHGYMISSPKDLLCPIEQIIKSVPEKATVRLVGQNKVEFNDWDIAYFSLRYNRAWAGQMGDEKISDYWIYRNGGYLGNSADSRYLSSSDLIAKYQCADLTQVSILKVRK